MTTYNSYGNITCCPQVLQIKNLGGSSFRRNPIIADLFHRMEKVERMGSGIKKMHRLMQEAELKEPVFEAGFFFRATFYRDPRYALKGEKEGLVEGLGERLDDKLGKRLGENQRKILNYLCINPKISEVELSKKIGISTTAVEKNVQLLKKHGLIKRIGTARGGHWEITENEG